MLLHFAFANKDAPNRFLKAAMTERLSSWDPVNFEARGVPGKAMRTAYGRWGEGGIGTILTGNIMPEYDQIAAPGDPVVPIDAPFHGDRFEAFKELAEVGKLHGSLMLGQLNHPGRQMDHRIQEHPISASDVGQEGEVLGMRAAKPHPASMQEIARIIEGFAHSAEYLGKAGFDGVELHAAHGYLLAQFLSTATNLRTDQYGGNIENRARLITEIAYAIRSRTKPSFIVGIKISSVKFQSQDFHVEDAKTLCALLEESHFDFVELSGGTLEHFTHKRESTKKREGFFVEFADLLTPHLTKTKTFVTGGFKTARAIVKALDEIDGVGLARPLCQEPQLCKNLLHGKVQGVIKQRPDESNYGLTNVVAGTQIGQLSMEQEPIDMSREENEKRFMRALESWNDKKVKDSEMAMYGYVDLSLNPI